MQQLLQSFRELKISAFCANQTWISRKSQTKKLKLRGFRLHTVLKTRFFAPQMSIWPFLFSGKVSKTPERNLGQEVNGHQFLAQSGHVLQHYKSSDNGFFEAN